MNASRHTTTASAYTVADGRPMKVSAAGTHFHPDTHADVAQTLDALIASQARARIFLGDTTTGVSWHEENDVAGRIGRSMGPCKVPLLVEANQSGGTHLLDHCIVAILGPKGTWLYKHPTLALGTWDVVPARFEVPITKGKSAKSVVYLAESRVNGTLHGRHKTPEAAQRFVDFMTGKRLAA